MRKANTSTINFIFLGGGTLQIFSDAALFSVTWFSTLVYTCNTLFSTLGLLFLYLANFKKPPENVISEDMSSQS